jgi:hypothetical protein
MWTINRRCTSLEYADGISVRKAGDGSYEQVERRRRTKIRRRRELSGELYAQAASRRSSASRRRRVDDRIAEGPPSIPAHGRKMLRGPAQPRAGDFQVRAGLPAPLPILDRELRAIEILLGNDLNELLAGNLASD